MGKRSSVNTRSSIPIAISADTNIGRHSGIPLRRVNVTVHARPTIKIIPPIPCKHRQTKTSIGLTALEMLLTFPKYLNFLPQIVRFRKRPPARHARERGRKKGGTRAPGPTFRLQIIYQYFGMVHGAPSFSGRNWVFSFGFVCRAPGYSSVNATEVDSSPIAIVEETRAFSRNSPNNPISECID